ncbi:hypothetical protein [Puia dinghuensis]|uniref:Uncharacterized protein n=1 Tax=Puia dinghuensis TaxID=1792502 RepID=A0A8J2XTY5_9BACT|nr:hypothetical protein [Puia dinghuensis]GGB03341.1 hypothetical protein GCM10011511_28270 [Puia dinghuensis]
MDQQLLFTLLLSFCSLGCYVILLRGLQIVLRTSVLDKQKQRTVFSRTAVLLAVWLLLIAGLSLAGFFSSGSPLPPRVAFPMLISLIVVLWVAFSPTGTLLLRELPPHWLIYFQSFRIVVEIIIWLTVLYKIFPVQLSFEGRNVDVLVGLLAFPVGYYSFIKKAWPSIVVLLYNIFGLLSLINVVAVTVLSLPTPIRLFHNQPDSSMMSHFPFIFIPSFLAPLAISVHILSIRQWVLARQPRAVRLT